MGGQGIPVIQYRSFRNTDPPGLVEVWNDALTGRGAVRLRHSSPLERFAFSKLYFDPAGLIVAEDAGRIVGFVHAGFGANAGSDALDVQTGVICLLAVSAPCRRRGIGTELLRRAEEYLRSRGAQHLFAGPLAPLNPFYLGLYGGSELPGFLDSDSAAEPFFTHRGYQACRTVRVLQRRLGVPVKVFDARFIGFRQRFELCEDSASHLGTWWQYNLFNGAEPRIFSLLDRNTKEYAAWATVWEMEGFSFRWNMPTVGVVDWFVRPEQRRQGIGKFLLAQLIRKAQEELAEGMELQVSSDNEPAYKLCRGLGFEQVDFGRMYQKRN
jgi:ribosomal protein S18 acetylase RimI-like enzyme